MHWVKIMVMAWGRLVEGGLWRGVVRSNIWHKWKHIRH